MEASSLGGRNDKEIGSCWRGCRCNRRDDDGDVVDDRFRPYLERLLDTSQSNRAQSVERCPLTGEFSGGAFALGLVAHMALAMMLGAVISVVAHLVAKGGASTVAIATAIALGAWVIQAFLWRAVDSAGSAAFTPWILAVGHVIFGMSAGAVIVTSERKAHIPESERSLPAFERAA